MRIDKTMWRKREGVKDREGKKACTLAPCLARAVIRFSGMPKNGKVDQRMNEAKKNVF